MTGRPLIVRSKNAGPFTLSVDVMFDDPRDAESLYRQLVDGTVQPVAGPEWTTFIQVFVDRRAAAVKITLGRVHGAGSWGDVDLYGCQQHTGVLQALGLTAPAPSGRGGDE